MSLKIITERKENILFVVRENISNEKINKGIKQFLISRTFEKTKIRTVEGKFRSSFTLIILSEFK